MSDHVHHWILTPLPVSPGVYSGVCHGCGQAREFRPYAAEDDWVDSLASTGDKGRKSRSRRGRQLQVRRS